MSKEALLGAFEEEGEQANPWLCKVCLLALELNSVWIFKIDHLQHGGKMNEDFPFLGPFFCQSLDV